MDRFGSLWRTKTLQNKFKKKTLSYWIIITTIGGGYIMHGISVPPGCGFSPTKHKDITEHVRYNGKYIGKRTCAIIPVPTV